MYILKFKNEKKESKKPLCRVFRSVDKCKQGPKCTQRPCDGNRYMSTYVMPISVFTGEDMIVGLFVELILAR